MRARLTTFCAGIVLLGACQLQVGTTVKKAAASPRPGSPEPVASDSAPAAGNPSPTPVATLGPTAPVAPDLLRPRPGANSVLKGVARLDANYIVAQGAGNIISGNAGAIVSQGAGNIIGGNASAVLAAGGGAIISGNAGAAIANAKGQIVAQGAGNVISGNGGAIIGGNASAIVAQGGGNIVSQGAGNIVSQGAGNIVAQGAGNIVAQGAGNRRLLAAAPDDGRVPVAGMPLTVVSLTTHQPVPVGVDKNGKDVYTVYTNAAGGFELWLPPEEKDNVLVLAQVKPDDANPRLAYGLVATPGEDASLDEDTALLSTYVRRGMGPFLSLGMLAKDEKEFEDKILGNAGLPLLVKNVIAQQYAELHEAAQRAHVLGAPEADVRALVQRMVDRMVTHMYLGSDPAKDRIVLTRSPSCNYWHGPDEPAVLAMQDILHLLRLKAREKLAANPAYFDGTDYVLSVNAIRTADGLPTYQIRKDSDLINMIVAEYFTETDDQRWAQKAACHEGAHFLFGMLEWIFEDLGMQTVDHVLPPNFRSFDQPTLPYTSVRFGQSDRAEEAFHAVLIKGFMLMASPDVLPSGKTIKGEILEILNDFKPSGLGQPSPTVRPSPLLPCTTPRPVPSKAQPHEECSPLI